MKTAVKGIVMIIGGGVLLYVASQLFEVSMIVVKNPHYALSFLAYLGVLACVIGGCTLIILGGRHAIRSFINRRTKQ